MRSRALKQYSTVSKILHWLIAFAVLGMLCVGFFLDDIPEQYQATAYMLHKSTGLTILMLMIIRFIWIHASGKPPLPATTKLWERVLTRIVQYSFYVLLIMMPLSGWIMSVAAGRIPVYFGLFKVPFPGIEENKSLAEFMVSSHVTIAWIIIAFIVLHVAGALKHHFINRDDVLRSMWPRSK